MAEILQKNKDVTKYTIITPTGDRHKLFKLCEKYVNRQTIPPSQWIVVDDGQKPITAKSATHYVRRTPLKSDPVHTLKLNIQVAIPLIKYDKILIFEDDDWYHPIYAKIMLKCLKRYNLVGLTKSIIYNVQAKRYKIIRRATHSAFATTAFKKSVITDLIPIINDQEDFHIDEGLWLSYEGPKKIRNNDGFYIGIKGMPSNRPGLTRPHDYDNHKELFDFKDKTYKILDYHLGDIDSAVYKFT